MFTQLYSIALLAIFAQSALAATCSRSYTVVEGDYCDKISQEQNVSTYQLSVINRDIVNQGCTNLMPGQNLCLGFAGEDCSTTHVVQPGDTCSDIAAANSLNMTILGLNNPQLHGPCNIYVGEVLCISNTVQVPPSNGAIVTMGGSAPVSTVAPLPPSTPDPIVATPTAVASNDNDNDEDLPYCDE